MNTSTGSSIRDFRSSDTAAPGRDAPIATLAKHGKTFMFAGRLLGRKEFVNAARLYCFCRYADDIADKMPNQEQARAQLRRIAINLETGFSTNPKVADFIDLARETGMDLRVVRELLNGLQTDLGTVRFVDERQLKRYCFRVAGTVGLLMCNVLGVRDPRAAPHAIDLGIAMQLTNIARDIAEDAQSGRRYLPAEWLGDISPESISAPDDMLKLSLQRNAHRLLTEADYYYRSGEDGLCYLPLRSRVAILVAAHCYRAIGNAIARAQFMTWAGRATVSGWRKAIIALRALGRFMFQKRYHRPPLSHDFYLHRSLDGLPSSHRTREHH